MLITINIYFLFFCSFFNISTSNSNIFHQNLNKSYQITLQSPKEFAEKHYLYIINLKQFTIRIIPLWKHLGWGICLVFFCAINQHAAICWKVSHKTTNSPLVNEKSPSDNKTQCCLARISPSFLSNTDILSYHHFCLQPNIIRSRPDHYLKSPRLHYCFQIPVYYRKITFRQNALHFLNLSTL